MHQYSIGGVPVVDKGKIIGIVSRRDVRAIVSKRGDEKITAIMTKKPIVADEDITADKALEIMYTNKVERLPVVNEKGKLIGIITMQDILEKRQYPKATRDAKGNLRVAAAVGPFDFARAELLDQNGVDALVVDCAHGHNMKVVAAVKEIKGSVKADVIAGNIATREAAEALVEPVWTGSRSVSGRARSVQPVLLPGPVFPRSPQLHRLPISPTPQAYRSLLTAASGSAGMWQKRLLPVPTRS